ncbi:hypothetical protein HY641_04950 [Candidatus Woesearchaeota archaeon]|nr:hypothetical protein [Candidatus Woesearchaeota archaeon]
MPKKHTASPRVFQEQRAQMEIMGLTIIILLVSIGILFAIGIISKPTEDIKRGYEQKQLAVNFLTTLLDTTSGCQLNTFRQLLMDCATDRIVTCPGGLDSCSYAKTSFRTIFSRTLDPIRKGYYLSVDGPQAVKSITQGSFGTSATPTPCPGERDQATQPIPTLGGGTIITRLEICDRPPQ